MEINEADDENLVPLNEQNDQSNLTWYILSILSWYLLLCFEFYSYLSEFSINNLSNYIEPKSNLPFYLNIFFPMITSKIFVFLFCLIGFVIYLIYTTCKKDENLFKSMISIWTKFHSIPFLLIIFAFIHSPSIINEVETISKIPYIVGLVFSFFGFVSLIFIYIKTNLPCEWYIVLSIKKGCFSSLITYSWFLIFYSTFKIYLSVYDSKNINNESFTIVLLKYLNTFNIAINVGISINGLGCLIYSLIFKDIVMLFTNILIYKDLLMYFSYKLKKMVISIFKYEEITKKMNEIILIFDIVGSVLIALFVAEITFIVIRFREKLFK